MNRKLFVLLSLVIAVSMVLTSCGTPTPEPVEAPTEVPAEVPTEATEAPVEETTPEGPRHGGWLDEIVVSVVDSASAVTQIKAGAIDIYAAGVSSDTLAEIEEAGLDYAQSNGLYYELTFNMHGPLFDQSTGKVNPFHFAKAREALNWLVDRDYINREVYSGGALPKFWSIITNMPDYTKHAETVRRLEAKYAYNPEKAKEQMDEVMLGIPGVTIEDGKYMFGGEQVTLIFIIRSDSDGTRVPIGDYVANQLESIGFAVDRQYKTSSEASPIWVMGNVADGLWHLYTGAWSATVIDRDEGDNFQFFDTPESAYGFSTTWQAMPTGLDTEYGKLADKLAYNKFATLEERDAAMAQMLEMALTESIHVWLIDGKNFTPYNEKVDVTYDLAAGVDGSQIWPYTIRLAGQEGGTLKWGAPDLFVDPWNPIAGSNWAFDQSIGRATWGEAYMYDPHTGLIWPQRFDRAEITAEEGLPIGKTLDWVDLSFEPEIVVPDDAIADWDAVNQKFITSAEKIELEKEAAAAAADAAQVALDDAKAALEALTAEKEAMTPEIKAAGDAAKTALEEAQAALDELTDEATEEEVAAAEASVTEAQAALDAVEGYVTPEEEEAASAAVTKAEAALEAATTEVADMADVTYKTAKIKSVVYYPEDLWETVKWHDGSNLDLADFIFDWIIGLDMGKEGSPIYDEAYAANAAANLANFRGFKILSENPLTIETYYTSYQTDAELNIGTLWPSFSYGEAPWHILAGGALADEAGEVAFSADKADATSTETKTVEWLSYIGGPSLEFLTNHLTEAADEGFIPYANVMAAYLTPEEATQRYNNALAFYEEYGHYNIGTGPYILAEVALTEKVATLKSFRWHPDPSDKWARYGDPKIAELEVEGEDTVVLGSEIVFDVFVTFEGETYPSADVKEVIGLLYDGTGQIVATLAGELVEEGHYTITVPADVSAAMVEGASKLEAVVVPSVVAIPSFLAFDFVTVK